MRLLVSIILILILPLLVGAAVKVSVHYERDFKPKVLTDHETPNYSHHSACRQKRPFCFSVWSH